MSGLPDIRMIAMRKSGKPDLRRGEVDIQSQSDWMSGEGPFSWDKNSKMPLTPTLSP
jgi:hypothetical protein